VALWAASTATTVTGAVYEIAPDGSGDFPTIRDALAVVEDGDEVVLADGVYVGLLNTNLNYLGRAVTIRSASDDPTACIIDCEGVARGVVSFTASSTPGLLRGVTVRNGWHPEIGGGLYVSGTTALRAENCVIEDCSSVQGGGVAARGGAELTLVDCVIQRNQAGDGGGAYFFENPSVRLENCVVVENQANRLGGGGIWGGFSASLTLVGSTLSGNRITDGDGAGLFVHANTHPRIETSIVWGNCDAAGDAHDIHVWDLSCQVTLACSVVNPIGHRGEDRVVIEADGVVADPLFCGDDAGCGGSGATVEDYGLADNSPCRASASPCGVRIGALDLGSCGVGTPVRAGTWGQIKTRFR
jgi:hypothetical protein